VFDPFVNTIPYLPQEDEAAQSANNRGAEIDLFFMLPFDQHSLLSSVLISASILSCARNSEKKGGNLKTPDGRKLPKENFNGK
jgi:hypothetical protein